MSKGENLFVFEFTRAVQASKLDPKIRYLLVTMASLADGHTGIGHKSQEEIADAMGYSDRYVRDLLKELEQDADAPFQIVRTRRLDGEGYRTSDRYQMVMRDADLTGTPSSAKVGGPYRNKTTTLPEQKGDLTGTGCSALSDLKSDLKSDLYSASREKVTKKVPVEGAEQLRDHYLASFKKFRGGEAKFASQWPKAMQAFGDLVSTHGLETAKRIVTNALANVLYVPKAQPWQIAENSNNYLTAAPVSRQTPSVQSGGYVEPEKSQKQKELDALAASLPG